MKMDCHGNGLEKLRVNGGMAKNDLLMQLQADILGSDCIRAQVVESSALGAAIAAGMAEGIDVWDTKLHSQPPEFVFKPRMAFLVSSAFLVLVMISIDSGLLFFEWMQEREQRFAVWKEAVKRSMNWTNVTEGKLPKAARIRLFPHVSHLSAFAVGIVAGICLFKFTR